MSFECLLSNSVWKMASKRKVLSLKEKVELINFQNIAAAFQGMHVSPANHSDTE